MSTELHAQPAFVPHMTLEEAQRLKLDDMVDIRLSTGQFVAGKVVQILDNRIQLLCSGYHTWADYATELYRFAVYKSISRRVAHRFPGLKKGDLIDVNPLLRHFGWKGSEIVDFDGGQIQVSYNHNGQSFYHWAHLDDKTEIAIIFSKSTVQSQAIDDEKNLHIALQLSFEESHQRRQQRAHDEDEKNCVDNMVSSPVLHGLIAMGFDAQAANNAAQICPNDLNIAVDIASQIKRNDNAYHQQAHQPQPQPHGRPDFSCFGAIGPLLQIIHNHQQFMKQREKYIDDQIEKQAQNSTLKAARRTALRTEKHLMENLLRPQALNEFLEHMISIENLFDALYDANQKQLQKVARQEYGGNISHYEGRPKCLSHAQSFSDLMFAGTSVYIKHFKDWMQNVEHECEAHNIKIVSKSEVHGKSIDRAFYKAFYVYGEKFGDAGYQHMTDVMRCSLVFDNFFDLYRCFALIERLCKTDEIAGGILRVKDRFHPARVPFGYRDLMINIYAPESKIVAEIQLHHALFYRHKQVSHDVYKKARLFEEGDVNMAYLYADQNMRSVVAQRVYAVQDEVDEKVEEKNVRRAHNDRIHDCDGKPMTYGELFDAWYLGKYIDAFVHQDYGAKNEIARYTILMIITDEQLRGIGFLPGTINRYRLYLKELDST